jgi:DNA repair protein RadC
MSDSPLAPGAILIRELPAEERPRERLARYGADVLQTAELIAILLRTGTAGTDVMAVASGLLKRFGGLSGLARAALSEISAAPGVGPAKAAELQAAIALGIRAASVSQDTRPLMKSPEDVADLVLNEMTLLDQEHVRVLSLDTRLRLLGVTEVYRGSVHSTHVRYAELLRDPVRLNAPAMVLVHNHPSGDPTPSAADISMTNGIREACKLLDIDLNDHMIIGGGRYVSLRALGLGFVKS